MKFWKNKRSVYESDKIPTTVEQSIPIYDIAEDGICLVGRNLYSKAFRFSDINYATASKTDKEEMFLAYSEILNSFDSGATTKISIFNRRMSQTQFERNSLIPLCGDHLDRYRAEYNQILERKADLSSGMMQNKYLTITVSKPSLDEARSYFNRICAEYTALFAKLGSKLEEVDATERLRIYFDFFHHGNEEDFHYNPSLYEKRGYSFKDSVAPDSMEFRADYFKVDGRFGRVLYLRDYANFIKDSFIAELTDIDRGMILSIDASPITTEVAVKLGENKLLSVETNISNWQRKQNSNNNFSATVPYDMERQREESREFLNDLVARDQRMIPALITLVHTADTKEQLDADTESIRQCARKHLCSLNILRWQQLEGLNTVLPYGAPKLGIRRTLTTESLAVFMPFRVQEVCHTGGIYFANNAISKNLIMVNRAELLNGNSFITGVSGSGKSILAKQEIINLYLSDKDADIIIIDPEREYGKIIDAFGGENIEISATSKNHINAMDINMDYADGQNPVTLKSEYMLSLCEQAVCDLGPKQKSLIDRCTANLLNGYMRSGFCGNAPTLKDFYEELKAQPEPEAKDIALSLELFTSGSLDTFANETNVDTKNRLICYDIHDLGNALMSRDMLKGMSPVQYRTHLKAI